MTTITIASIAIGGTIAGVAIAYYAMSLMFRSIKNATDRSRTT